MIARMTSCRIHKTTSHFLVLSLDQHIWSETMLWHSWEHHMQSFYLALDLYKYSTSYQWSAQLVIFLVNCPACWNVFNSDIATLWAPAGGRLQRGWLMPFEVHWPACENMLRVDTTAWFSLFLLYHRATSSGIRTLQKKVLATCIKGSRNFWSALIRSTLISLWFHSTVTVFPLPHNLLQLYLVVVAVSGF